MTHAQLAAQLLRDAANFFKTVAEQNPLLAETMAENASVFEDVADLVEKDPLAELPGDAGPDCADEPGSTGYRS